MTNHSSPPLKSSSDARILVIDDEPDLRTLYELTLLRQGYQVETAGTVSEALAVLTDHRFDAVITDMRLPDGLGLEILNYLAQHQRPERCMVMTAYGSAENAVESLKAGAFDYLTKPVDLKQFRTAVAAAIHESQVTASQPAAGLSSSQTLSTDPTPRSDEPLALQRLVGESDVMRAVKSRIARVARSMAPVLVHGESGTGKELVAKAIHGCSHRSDGPFVAVNCGAIPENLLEAEFFGAKKGSYTGANQDREGYFQAARHGTLFLDEIGDLPLAMQSKLLRAIQERSVRALGSTTEDAVDVRIVSATHKDLAVEVQAGRFRQDLFYRLNVIDITIPPLRERRADLQALCTALLSKLTKESGLPAPQLSPQLLDQLHQLPLHGNVRELENLLHRALALHDGSELDFNLNMAANRLTEPPEAEEPVLAVEPPAPAPHTSPQAAPQAAGGRVAIPDDLQAYLDAQERAILVQVLQETQFNRTAAAARLKLSLRQIRYRIARLNIAMPHTDDNGTDDAGDDGQ